MREIFTHHASLFSHQPHISELKITPHIAIVLGVRGQADGDQGEFIVAGT
ncbi:MAG: hypothetical protein HC875_14125 [Anaerolineales bacterium]|nr:hypothetical protein [Anaerolineales bacterium]